MSMIEILKNHKPVENPEFGAKKKLVGDAVCQIQSLEKITAKSGAPWVVLKTSAIHPIADPKGRETTIVAGEEITIVYDPTDAEAIEQLDNDLFTSGIEYNKSVDTEEQLLASMSAAAKDRLMYLRCWAKDKTEEQKAKNPNKPGFFQNIVVKSKNLITPENSVPVLPF
jgi:hypothetical protein